MEPIIILIVAGVGMSLISIPVIAIFFALEEEQKKNEIKRFVRRKIIKEMREEDRGMKEKIDLLEGYKD